MSDGGTQEVVFIALMEMGVQAPSLVMSEMLMTIRVRCDGE